MKTNKTQDWAIDNDNEKGKRKMNEQKIYDILTDALKAANATFDTDGSTIWVEADGGRTFDVCVSGRESGEIR